MGRGSSGLNQLLEVDHALPPDDVEWGTHRSRHNLRSQALFERSIYQRGYVAAREELLPLLRGALGIIRNYAGELEHLGDDADLALVGHIEEVVKE